MSGHAHGLYRVPLELRCVNPGCSLEGVTVYVETEQDRSGERWAVNDDDRVCKGCGKELVDD